MFKFISFIFFSFFINKKKLSKRTRKEYENTYTPIDESLLNPRKKRKIQIQTTTNRLNTLTLNPNPQDIGIGKPVKVQFNYNTDLLLARIMIIEKFGILIVINEESLSLPDIKKYSKHWARFKGEYSFGIPLLDIIHSAE